MEKLANLLGKIKGVRVHVSGTGTAYVYAKGKKIRLSDHEPNYGAPNRGCDKYYYTHDISGKQVEDIFVIAEEIVDYLGIELPPAIKGVFTRKRNERWERQARLTEIRLKNEAELEAAKKRGQKKREVIKEAIAGKEDKVREIMEAAEAYGDLGSNGKKRRKRRKSFFERNFEAEFGFKVSLGDIKQLIEI